MPPQQAAKRKASPTSRTKPAPDASPPLPKKAKHDKIPSDPLRQPHHLAAAAEAHGIVQRAYYPAEMSNARARAYANGQLPRPMDALSSALASTAAATTVQGAVVHWFRADLRVGDNRALRAASEAARAGGVPLLCLYAAAPADWAAHLTAPARVDFVLRTLRELRADLAALRVPLHVETVAGRGRLVAQRVAELVARWRASHLFANAEYEVDELRRDAALVRLCADRGIAVDVLHDTCVVAPGELRTRAGHQYAVYTPWFRSWVAYVHAHPETLRAYAAPEPNPPGTLEREWEGLRAAGEIPEAPEEKRLAEAERLRALWPAGEAEAHRRLDKFCRERIARYADRRDRPAEAATSSLSVHLAAGTLSARAAVRAARECSGADRLDAGDEGARTWIGEVAWRDFYRHVLVHWPYVCMNKPFKPEYSNMEWSYDAEHFAAWREGRTGFPIVDAAMRQMRGTGWMHNRCRMIAASFLAKDLLLDWRMGERFFMESLIDGDFASNSGGWGFGASVGVDPQPYFRIFNPLLQSEKFDPDGAYIRKWVPELRAVEGKAIHDPYGRGAAAQAKKMGYPEPIVNHKESRERALSVYKAAQEKDKS